MLNTGILLLLLINFGFIALLPRKFFKQGAKLNAHFWLTAAPLFACPAMLALAHFAILPPWLAPDQLVSVALQLVAVIISCVSIVLLGMAIGTHRIPIHMFHDQEDQKGITSHLVTYGPYRYIRHPIYSSYLLALFAAFIFCPQIGTLACWVYGLIVLSKTGAQEEAKLCASSDLGPEYTEYMKHTGRFLPPLSAFTLKSTTDAKSAQASPDLKETPQPQGSDR